MLVVQHIPGIDHRTVLIDPVGIMIAWCCRCRCIARCKARAPCPMTGHLPVHRHAGHGRHVMLHWLTASTSRHIHTGHIVVHGARSEEHTSELPSLMRISYAVFCLKKKNTIYYTQP